VVVPVRERIGWAGKFRGRAYAIGSGFKWPKTAKKYDLAVSAVMAWVEENPMAEMREEEYAEWRRWVKEEFVPVEKANRIEEFGRMGKMERTHPLKRKLTVRFAPVPIRPKVKWRQNHFVEFYKDSPPCEFV